ncbi:hypothetical protein D3C75_678010 [compost metagenome]
MYAQRDQRHPQCAYHRSGNGRAEVIQRVIDATDGTANHVADRAKGQQRQWHHDRDTEHRREQVADHQRQDAFKETLHIRHDPDHQDDRDHRGGIAEILHRHAQEGEGIGINRDTGHLGQHPGNLWVIDGFLHQSLHGRIGRVHQQDFIGGEHVHIVWRDQCTGCDHRSERIDVEFFRGGEGHHHRQEGEAGPGNEVQNTIGAACRIHPAQGSKQRNEPLQHPAGCQRIQEGGEDAGDYVHQAADDADVRRADRHVLIHIDQFEHFPIGIADVVANHHLQLPTGFDNGNNAFDAFQRVFIGLASIF